jgi:hypothetical protein
LAFSFSGLVSQTCQTPTDQVPTQNKRQKGEEISDEEAEKEHTMVDGMNVDEFLEKGFFDAMDNSDDEEDDEVCSTKGG